MAQTKAQLIGTIKEPFSIPVGTTNNRPINPPNGTLRYNTTTNSIEYYSTAITNWTSIQPIPQITAVSPVTFNGNSGTTFTLTGSNFNSTDTVKFITSNGTEYTAGTYTYISATSATVTTPQNFTVSQEPLDLKIINSSGSFSVFDANIDCGGVPTWNTSSGSLGTSLSGSAISVSVSASDAEGTITYSVTSGSLPPSTSLNSSSGAITGTPPQSFVSTTYNFTITASDGVNSTSRAFSYTVNSTNYFGSGADGTGSFT